jgi:hypothetical protein
MSFLHDRTYSTKTRAFLRAVTLNAAVLLHKPTEQRCKNQKALVEQARSCANAQMQGADARTSRVLAVMPVMAVW